MRRSRPLTVLLAAVAMVFATMGLAAPAQASGVPAYKIQFNYSGLCLTVYNGSPIGSAAMQWNCDGFDNGLWLGRIMSTGSRDWYELINKATGECLTIHYGSYQLGAEAVLGSCAPSNPYNLVTWYV